MDVLNEKPKLLSKEKIYCWCLVFIGGNQAKCGHILSVNFPRFSGSDEGDYTGNQIEKLNKVFNKKRQPVFRQLYTCLHHFLRFMINLLFPIPHDPQEKV